MRIVLALVIGIAVGMGVLWDLSDRPTDQTAHARETTREVDPEKDDGSPRDVEDTFDPDKIKEELSRTGQVVREKMREAGKFLGDVADNATTTGSIKAKLLKDPLTSGLSIDVDTTDGVVTLSGKVDSHEEIARAMSLAMDTGGVRKVISTLQVEEPQPVPEPTR
jgi:hypothetical protein